MLNVPARKTARKRSRIRLPIEDVEFLPHPLIGLSPLRSIMWNPSAIFRKSPPDACPGGTFVFSVEHPVFTAQERKTGITAGTGASCTGPWTYFTEAGAMGHEPILKTSRTPLTTYVNTLLLTGFKLTGLAEPGSARCLISPV